MKKTAIFLSVLVLIIGACKKDNKTSTPGNNNNNNTPSPYYFKFALGSVSYNLNADLPQYMTFYPNVIGGYEIDSAGLYPSVGLSFTWPSADTVRESDVLGLIGKTLYYSDTSIQPQLSFDLTATSATWNSIDTSNTSYNVKITNVVFLKKDTTLGVPIRTYVITGTCSAVMLQTSTPASFSGGQFNFIISRQDH